MMLQVLRRNQNAPLRKVPEPKVDRIFQQRPPEEGRKEAGEKVNHVVA
jgi:hypothetical protein